jgi:nucleotide-binding universal stress UspA family protein
MLQFNKILCPIDFSPISMRALIYATALTRWSEGELEVLHVAPLLEADGEQVQVAGIVGAAHAGPAPVRAVREQALREIGRAIAAAGANDVDARALVLEGSAHDVIVSRSRMSPADLLVMGTHGHGGFTRLLLGSVTEKVLRHVACPVFTVPPATPDKPEDIAHFRRILCPIDYSPSSLRALRCALDLARQAGGCVTALHALEYMDPEDEPEPSPYDPCRQAVLEHHQRGQELVERARKRLHAQLAPEPTTWCDIEESTVVVDRAYKAILRQAQALDVDLIVMGAQGTGGLELMVYGSNTQHVLRAAACPVLTVKG